MGFIMTGLTRILPYILFFISSSQLTEASQGPIVALDYGSFQGNLTGDSVKFLGIPFAAPPYVIALVLGTNFSFPSIKCGKTPFCTAWSTNSVQGRSSGDFLRSCMLSTVSRRKRRWFGFPWYNLPCAATYCSFWKLLAPSPVPLPTSSFLNNLLYLGLFINVFKPANIPEGKKLPVVFVRCQFITFLSSLTCFYQWIYGGRFYVSEPRCKLNIFQGHLSQEIVLHSRETRSWLAQLRWGHQWFMYHRTTVLVVSLILSHETSTIHTLYDEAFGFLQGKEAKNAGIGNIGLRDRKCVWSLRKHCFMFFPVRTICSSVASKVHWRVWRRPEKSNDVCSRVSMDLQMLIHLQKLGGERRGYVCELPLSR